jgi:hypothetical protein
MDLPSLTADFYLSFKEAGVPPLFVLVRELRPQVCEVLCGVDSIDYCSTSYNDMFQVELDIVDKYRRRKEYICTKLLPSQKSGNDVSSICDMSSLYLIMTEDTLGTPLKFIPDNDYSSYRVFNN